MWTDSRSIGVRALRYLAGRCSIQELNVPNKVRVNEWVRFTFVGHVDNGPCIPVIGIRNEAGNPGEVLIKIGGGAYYTIPPGGTLIRRMPDYMDTCSSFSLPSPYYIKFKRSGYYRLTFMVGYWTTGASWTQVRPVKVNVRLINLLAVGVGVVAGFIGGYLIGSHIGR